MTNPDNIVRVRARNGGRASVYEANGWAQAFTSGLLEGSGVTQNTSADMNVLVGGSATKPDVVLAENPAGYKIALDLVGKQAVALTAPASNSRISAIVAYTDDLSLATTEDTVTGSPASCGLIVVNGTAASTPVAPTDNQIRTAITADGATGSQAAYCVIATVLVASNTTTITDSLIMTNTAAITASNIDFTTFNLGEEQVVGRWIDGSIMYRKTINFGALPNNTTSSVAHGISNLGLIIKIEGAAWNGASSYMPLPNPSPSTAYSVEVYVNGANLSVYSGTDRSSFTTSYITLYYTK